MATLFKYPLKSVKLWVSVKVNGNLLETQAALEEPNSRYGLTVSVSVESKGTQFNS